MLLPDEKETQVDELAQSLGLKKVGWIFTDLIADDIKKGTVSYENFFSNDKICVIHLSSIVTR